MFQITLVPNKHQYDMLLGMIPQLRHPFSNIGKRLWLRNVIYQQCPHGISIVGIRNSAVSFLTSSIPYLSLYCCTIGHLQGTSRKFHTNSRLGINFELVFCITEEHVRFPHTRVSDEHKLEEVVVIFCGCASPVAAC